MRSAVHSIPSKTHRKTGDLVVGFDIGNLRKMNLGEELWWCVYEYT
jgi:hypothetical protein